jgi:RHS repeat-associated protein
MVKENRNYSSLNYRYGFNGKENDNEIKGVGNQQDYGFRIYDPRLGKFLSVDPLAPSYPYYSPYSFAGNKPIVFVDIDGLEEGERAAKAGAALSKWTNEKIESTLKKAHLGPHEQKVVKANPFDAYRSRTADKIAYSVQQDAGFGFNEGESGDAFRHTFWNALMTKNSNSDFADKFGKAHEEDNPNDAVQKQMDILNNRVGQDIADNNPNSTNKELALKVLDKIYKGEAYMVQKNDKGENELVKSHMTKEDYETKKKAIDTIDFSKTEKAAETETSTQY